MRRLLPLAFLLFLLVNVAPPDAGSAGSLPILPGVTWEAIRQEAGPWEIRVLRIDRAALAQGATPGVDLEMGLAGGTVKGVEKLSDLVRRETRENQPVVAAVNADFFAMADQPMPGCLQGMTVRAGELITLARGQPAFVMMADGTPRIGVFDTVMELTTPMDTLLVRGLNQQPVDDGAILYSQVWGFDQTTGCVVLHMPGLPLRPQGIWEGRVHEIVPPGTPRQAAADELLLTGAGSAAEVVGRLAVGDPIRLSLRTGDLDGPVALAAGGGPILLHAGQPALQEDPAAPRHPRTLAGFSDREILLVTVDGRQRGWSVGMTCYETARLMQDLGCTEAVNLDGGGSTTMWVQGQVVNRPSGGVERLIANAILVRAREPLESTTERSDAP